MKHRNLYIAIIVALIMPLAACSDYLEETNPNRPSADIYWANLDETQATLNGVYAGLMDQYLMLIQRESYRSDMAFPGDRNKPLDAMAPWYSQLYNNATAQVNDKWALCYQGIFRANQVIEGLSRLEGSVEEERWTEQMAQAKFFRGLFHFYLHSSYNNGNVPINDSYAKSVDDIYRPISTSEEVIKFFREDLKYAYDNLPYQFDEKGKITKGAAANALGTSHLYQGEYALAKPYFSELIHNSDYGYELVDDMSLLFTNAGEFNKESIFEISYTLDFNSEYTQWQPESMVQRLSRYSSPTGSSEFVPSSWLVYEYQNEEMDLNDSRNYVIDDNGNSRLRSATLRASAMIALPQDLDTEYYLRNYALEDGGVRKVFLQNKVAYFKHYTNHSVVDDEENIGGTSWKSGKNVVVNRLGEVYLMLAECLIQEDDITGALSYINEVRARWALQLLGTDDGSGPDFDGITYDKNTLMDRLMYIEKPLECSIEGHSMRFIDMRRWGITKQRFQELSQQTWYIGNFTYLDPTTGETLTRKNCFLYTEEPATYGIAINEYELAASNYVNEVHDYFPLPLSETLNNPNISN